MKETLKRVIKAFDIRKFIKFGMIGVLNTLVDVAVFAVALRALCAAAGYDSNASDLPLWLTAVAQAISFVTASLNSFLWNKRWTFEKKNRVTRQEAVRFIVTNLGYYLVSLFLIRAVATLFRVPDKIAKLPATFCMILYNYLMNKFWVFK
ncbi:MAG TPA: GtrA family protein [Pseudoflavonifractor sp.]|nr:GtrA family protein [Pseudoflavonifractor sp.]